MTYELIEHWDLTIKQEMTDGTLQSVLCQATIKWFTENNFEGSITQPRDGIKYKIMSGFARCGLFKGSISFEAVADNGTVRYFHGEIIDEWSIFGHLTSKDEKEHDDANVRWSAFRQRKQMEIDLIFEVDEAGTISYADFCEVKTRDEAYDLSLDYNVSTPGRLVSAAEDCPPLQSLIANRYAEYRKDCAHRHRRKSMPKDSDKGWMDWVLGMDDQTFSSLREHIREWLSEEPHWAWEEDYIHYSKKSNGAAYFFENEPFDVLDALGVTLVEGPPPISYLGAELCRPIEEVNVIAEFKGLDYRFRKKADKLK